MSLVTSSPLRDIPVVPDTDSGCHASLRGWAVETAGHCPCPDDCVRDDTRSQLNTHHTKLREDCYPWHPWYGRAVVIHAAFVRHGQAVLRCTLDHKERSSEGAGNVGYGGMRNPLHNRKGACRSRSTYGCAPVLYSTVHEGAAFTLVACKYPSRVFSWELSCSPGAPRAMHIALTRQPDTVLAGFGHCPSPSSHTACLPLPSARYCAVAPPSITNSLPVTKDDSSEAR